MSFKYLKIELVDSVNVVTINRPDALNALNDELLSELSHMVDQMESTGQRAFILTGSGKAFVAGADIAKMKDMNPEQAEEFAALGQSVMNRIQKSDVVSIAAVNGFALGGGLELALACDIRIASQVAVMGLPEVTLGLIPGFGGTQRLARIAGIGKANELVLTGDKINADAALQSGIVNHVVTPEELIPTSVKMAKSITSRGPNAVKSAKKIIRDGLDVSLDAGLEVEKIGFSNLFKAEEPKEGLSAFLEKRKPNF